jgi:hypothetical protein
MLCFGKLWGDVAPEFYGVTADEEKSFVLALTRDDDTRAAA